MMRALRRIAMSIGMRLYVCWAAWLFCLVLSVGELQADSATAPLWRRIGARVMRALDSAFAAVFTMNEDHVREAYDAARRRVREMEEAD
jgi:hypothetical protein